MGSCDPKGFFPTLSYESGISPRVGLVGFLSVSRAGCSIPRFVGVVGEGTLVTHLKTPPQVKHGEKEQEKAPGSGVMDAVVTQGVHPRASPFSHTALAPRAVSDVKSPIPASFPAAAAPCSCLTSVPRAAGGALLGPSEQRLLE